MKYLFIQCFCIINIFFKTFTLFSINDDNSNNIDNFIRHLLTSRKFDELTDKIADKAVDKIIKFEQRSQGSKLNSILSTRNNKNIQETQYRLQDKPVKQLEDRSGQKTKSPDDDTPQTNKIGKINMQAFMKKDASLKSDDRSLKYKYLAQKVRNNQVTKDKQHKQSNRGSMVLRNDDNLNKKSLINSKQEKKISKSDEIDKENQNYEDVLETSHDNINDESIAEQEREQDKSEQEREDDSSEHDVDQHVMKNIYHREADYENYQQLKSQSEDVDAEDRHYDSATNMNHEDDTQNMKHFSKVNDKIKNSMNKTAKKENKSNEHVKSHGIQEKGESLDYGDDASKSNEDSYVTKVTSYDNIKNANKMNHEDDAQNTMHISKVDDKIKKNMINTEKKEKKSNDHAKSHEIQDKDETLDHGHNFSKDNDDSDENKVTSHDNSKNKTLNRFRTEGNKKFVFVSAPEYNEYLEEYDQVRKDNPANDFF